VKYLFFVDVETTGIDEQHDLLLEIAGCVLDAETLDQVAGMVEWPVAQGDTIPKVLLDPWVLETHTNNGLFDAVVSKAARPISEIDEELSKYLGFWVSEDEPKIRVAGASVHFDLRFIRRCLPKTAALLHHRVFDTSTLKGALKTWTGLEDAVFVKNEAHRAVADVEEEICNARILKHLICGTT